MMPQWKFKRVLIAFATTAISIILGASATSAQASSIFPRGWKLDQLPVNLEGSRISDPDHILPSTELETIASKLELFEFENSILVQSSGDNPESAAFGIQVAVTLIRKMDLSEFRMYNEDDREEMAAKAFATHLHNSLGVGHETFRGGSGVFIFMSVEDRVMYISRGGALDKILTDSRIDRIILGLRPLLRRLRYGDAVLETIHNLQKYLEQGEPNFSEKFWDLLPNLIPLTFAGSFALASFLGARKNRRDQQEYAEVASQLSQIDRAQAQALQGRYQATSCPICLENFASDSVGSDEQPIKLLRCGHVFDESCWSSWVSSGHGNVTKCPICQKDVGVQPEVPASPEGTEIPEGATLLNNHSQQHNNNQDDNDVYAPGREDSNRAVRHFNQERNFRLARLHQRHPRFIRPRQLQRWTQSTFDGQLAQDRSFVRSDPKVVQRETMTGNSGFGGGHSTFGGGRSSGGRSGRW